MLRFLLIIFLFIHALEIRAEEVVISGKANQPGLLIRLIITEDLVSGSQKLVASTQTDFRGRFELKAQFEKPAFVHIAAGPDKAEILLLPGGTYNLLLDDKPDFEQQSYYEREPLRFQLVSANDRGAHEQLQTINLIVNTFILQHFNDLYKKRRTALVDSLRKVLERRLPSFAHDYIADYTRYKIASLEFATRQRNTEAIIEQYIQNDAVLYDNVEYMSLFQQVFNSYLLNSRRWNHDDIKKNLSAGFEPMKNMLRTDPVLAVNDRLLELVLLVSLNEIYFNRSFNQNEIREMLKEALAKSVYPDHSSIASGIIKVNGHLSYGSVAPEFNLYDERGKKYSSQNEANTDIITVLNFVRKDCQPCRAAYEDLQKLITKFGNKIQVITIATGSGFHETRKFFEENKYTWLLLNLSDEWHVLEDYQVKSFPEFVILLPGHKTGMAPAPSPDQGLEAHIQRLMRLSGIN